MVRVLQVSGSSLCQEDPVREFMAMATRAIPDSETPVWASELGCLS